MNDEVIIPVKVEAEQGNVKQTLDQIRSYMKGLEKRRIDLINQKNLAVTKTDIQAIDENLSKTEGIIANIKSQYAQINEYLAKASQYEDRTYGQAREASLRNQNSLQEQINKKTADLAKYQEIVTEADKRQAEEEQRILDSKISEMQSVTAKMKKPKNELSQLNTALSKNQSEVEASMERQMEYSQRLFELQKARVATGDPTASKDERLLAQKVKVEKETQAQLLAEQRIIEENISKRQLEYRLLQQERAAIQAAAKEEAKRTRYVNDAETGVSNAEAYVQSIQGEIAALEQRLSVEQKNYDTINQEIAAGKGLEEVYSRIYNSSESRRLVGKGMLGDFERVTKEVRTLTAETGKFEQENRDAEADLLRLSTRYNGLIGQLRKMYDISKERVAAEAEANAELGKTSGGANVANNAFYKLVRSTKMLDHELWRMNQNVNNLGAGFIKAGKTMAKTILALSTGFLSLAASIKKTAKAHKGLSNEFKLGLSTILKYGFGIRSLFVLFNRLRRGIVDALKALAIASDYVNQEISSLVTSIKYMEAAMATVVQPILKVLAPALEVLSAAFEKAAYYCSSFIATLTGQNFVFRAQRAQVDFAKSLDKTGKAAKKARKELGYYDKLNVIHKDDKKGSGSGLEDQFAGFDYKKSPLLKEAKKLAKRVKKFVKDFFKPLKKAWKKDGEWVSEQWKDALTSIKDLLGTMSKDFIDVWNEKETQKIFGNILKTLGHIGGFFKNLANSIRTAWEKNSIGRKILEKIRDILIGITDSVNKIAEGFEKWALDTDFYTLFEDFYDLLDSLEKGPLKKVREIVEDFFDTVVYPFMQYMVEKGLPKLFKKIEEIANKIDWDLLKERMHTLFTAVEEFDEKLWDAFIVILGDLGDAVAKVVNSETFGKLIDWFKDWVETTDAETMAKDIEQVAAALFVLKGALAALKGVTGILTTLGAFGIFGKNVAGATGAAGGAAGVAGIGGAAVAAEKAAKSHWWDKLILKIGNVTGIAKSETGAMSEAVANNMTTMTDAVTDSTLQLSADGEKVAAAFSSNYNVVGSSVENGVETVIFEAKSGTEALNGLGTAGAETTKILSGDFGVVTASAGNGMTELSAGADAAASSMTAVSESSGMFASASATVGGGLATMAGGILNLLGFFMQLDGEISVIDVALTGLGAVIAGIGLAVIGVPGAIAAAIAAVAFAVEEFIAWIANYPQEVAEFFSNLPLMLTEVKDNLLTWISDTFYDIGKKIGKGFGKIIGKIAKFLISIPEKIAEWWDEELPKIKEGLKELPSKIDEFIQETDWAAFGEAILEGILFIFTAPIQLATFIGQAITSLVGGFIDGIKEGFDINSPSKVMQPYGEYILEGILEGITGAITGIGSWLKTNLVDKFMEGINTAFGIVNGVCTKVKEVGTNIVDGLKQGVEDGVKTVKDIGKNIGDTVIGGAKNALGIQSPSKVFRQIGLYVDEGLTEGIKGGTKDATKAASNTAEEVIEAADTPFDLNNVTAFADMFIDTLTSMSTNAVSIISAMIDTINDKLSDLEMVDSLNTSLSRISKTKVPKIAQGFSVPAAIQLQKKDKDEFDWNKLSDIIRNVMEDTVGNISNDSKDPVVLMLSGKQIAKVVWDETSKKYKQTGSNGGYAFS